MNLRSRTFVAFGLLAILSLAAWIHQGRAVAAPRNTQSSAPESRLITVSGDAEVRVVPDEVVLTLGVETWDKNLQVAKSQNDTIVTRVLDVAGDHGIEVQHVQTGHVGIEPRYRNGYYEERDFLGYFVHRTIVITLRDISRFEDLLADALEAGVNYAHGIEFRTTELRQHRDDARALAIKAAREKAVALASELGQSVGDPQLIREEQSGWRSGYNAWWGAGWGSGLAQNVVQEIATDAFSGDGSLAPGLVGVNARVSVTFEIAD